MTNIAVVHVGTKWPRLVLPHISPGDRFQKVGRKIVRQGLQQRLQATPDDRKLLGRLGSLEVADGDLENAVEHLRLAAKVRGR